jgi:hypothetical protein
VAINNRLKVNIIPVPIPPTQLYQPTHLRRVSCRAVQFRYLQIGDILHHTLPSPFSPTLSSQPPREENQFGECTERDLGTRILFAEEFVWI